MAVPWVRAHPPPGAGAGSSRTLPAFLVTNTRCISAQHGTWREEMRTAAGRCRGAALGSALVVLSPENALLGVSTPLCCGGMGFHVPTPVLPTYHGEAALLPPWPIPSHPAQTPPVCPQTQGLVPKRDCFHHSSVRIGVILMTGTSTHSLAWEDLSAWESVGIGFISTHPEVALQGLFPITTHFSWGIPLPCRQQLRHPLLPAGGLRDALPGETEAGEADKICPELCKNLRIIHSN